MMHFTIPQDGPSLVQIHLTDKVFNKIVSKTYQGQELPLFLHTLKPNFQQPLNY